MRIFLSAFAVLYGFAGRGFLRSTFSLRLACTIWDLFACVVGTWVAQTLMKLRTAAPLLGGAIAGAGLASMTFWIYRGYGRFLFEGTWADVSCFFTEGAGITFPFVVAPALGFLTLLHGILWLRTSRVVSVGLPYAFLRLPGVWLRRRAHPGRGRVGGDRNLIEARTSPLQCLQLSECRCGLI